MKSIYEATTSARWLVIHVNYADKRMIVEESASIEYAERVIIAHETEKYMASDYLVVRNEDRRHILVVDKLMKPVAMFAIVKINRRIHA
jgi:hypothetical protein